MARPDKMKKDRKNKIQNSSILGLLSDNPKYLYASLFVFVFLLYGNTLFHQYNLDDELVTRNHQLTSQGIKAIPEIFRSPYYKDNMGYAYEYRPMVLISFAIEHSLFGERAWVSHFINILLYALSVIFLFRVLKNLFLEENFIFYYLATLLFIAHPLHTEVVANIKNRDEILALFFVLLSWRHALFYVNKNGGFFYFFLAAIVFLLALLSKISISPFMVLIPLSLVLFHNAPWKKLLLISATFSLPTFFLFPFEHLHIKLGIIAVVVAVPMMLKLFFVPKTAYRQLFEKLLLLFNNNFKEIRKNITFTQSQFYPENQIAKFNFVGAWIISLIFIILSYLAFKLDFHPYYILLGSIILFAFYVAVFKTYPVFFLLLAFLVSFTSNTYLLAYPSQLLMIFYAVLWFHYKKNPLGNYLLISIILLYVGQLIIDIGDWYSLILSFVVAFIFFHKNTPKGKWALYFMLIMFLLTIIIFPSRTSFITSICILILAFAPLKFGKYTFFTAIVLLIFLHPNFKPYKKVAWIPKTTIEVPDKIKSILPKTDRPINFVEMPMKHSAPLSIKIGMAADVMLRYMRLMVIPYPLSFYYGYAYIEPSEWSNTMNILSLLLHIVLVLVSFYLLRSHPIISFSIWLYVSTLFLFSNFPYPVVGIMGDRFTYAASLGFVIIITCLLQMFNKSRLSASANFSAWPTNFKIASLILLLSYFVLTVYRNSFWENHLTLMRHDIHHLEKSAQAHNLLALNLMKYEQTDNKFKNKASLMHEEASYHFKRATEIYPLFFNAWFDLGRTYWHRNLTDSALYAFEGAYKADSVYSELLMNLAILNEEKNNLQKAVFYYEKLIQLHPDYREGYNNLSYLYYRLNQPEASIQTNLKAIQANKYWAEAYDNIATVYQAIGDTVAAQSFLNQKPQQ